MGFASRGYQDPYQRPYQDRAQLSPKAVLQPVVVWSLVTRYWYPRERKELSGVDLERPPPPAQTVPKVCIPVWWVPEDGKPYVVKLLESPRWFDNHWQLGPRGKRRSHICTGTNCPEEWHKLRMERLTYTAALLGTPSEGARKRSPQQQAIYESYARGEISSNRANILHGRLPPEAKAVKGCIEWRTWRPIVLELRQQTAQQFLARNPDCAGLLIVLMQEVRKSARAEKPPLKVEPWRPEPGVTVEVQTYDWFDVEPILKRMCGISDEPAGADRTREQPPSVKFPGVA